MHEKPIAAGKTSFGRIDSDKLFTELNLKTNTIFLDVACGRGAYSLAAAETIGKEGMIYAVDLWKEGLDLLMNEIESRHIKNIQVNMTDVSRRIPVGDQSVDICLLATVLHDLILVRSDVHTMKEIKRVLKPQGVLAVIEFKKTDGPPGPPLSIRLSPEELEKKAEGYGFRQIRSIEIGKVNYLSLFVKNSPTLK